VGIVKLHKRTVRQLANLVVGNQDVTKGLFPYRSSKYITEFFEEMDTDYEHDGTTRAAWAEGVIAEILIADRRGGPAAVPDAFARLINRLMDLDEREDDDEEGRPKALALLNDCLARDGFEAFYGEDKRCYLKHIATKTVAAAPAPDPHKAFSIAEAAKRNRLADYLERASEDDLIEKILLPLFRQLGYRRITAAGHRDKALEYGKDVWMKYVLPTTHVLYFGLQAKKDKLDASGAPKATNANVAEIHQQALMMLGHEIFDPEINRRVLVDHALIVAGGEITKQARNWLGNKLDASKRSQIQFMDREDILNLYVAADLPLPGGA
jgi:hypothetical protein